MRKLLVGVAVALFTAALGIGPASATTNVKLLTGTATFSDSGTVQVLFGNPPGCFVTDSEDGTFAGQFIAKPVNTPVESGSFHSAVTCANVVPGTNLLSGTGTVTVTTLVGTVNATEVGSANLVTNAKNVTWTVTGGTGAYTNASGTVTLTGQDTPTGPVTFTESGTLTFNVTR